MSERKPGWYWVKWPSECRWSAARYLGRAGERLMWSSGDIIQSDAPVEIGPRIPTPDEPWQMVPVEPTPEMLKHGFIETQYDEGRGNRMEVYRAMLAASPKPENS